MKKKFLAMLFVVITIVGAMAAKYISSQSKFNRGDITLNNIEALSHEEIVVHGCIEDPHSYCVYNGCILFGYREI